MRTPAAPPTIEAEVVTLTGPVLAGLRFATEIASPPAEMAALEVTVRVEEPVPNARARMPSEPEWIALVLVTVMSASALETRAAMPRPAAQIAPAGTRSR